MECEGCLRSNCDDPMPLSVTVSTHSDLDFGVILEGLLLYPESYVNFGKHWWTLKRMLADWAEENSAPVDARLLRGSQIPNDNFEVEEHEVYNFLDQFSGREDFRDWISFINPQPAWDEVQGEEISLEDVEWEESFL